MEFARQLTDSFTAFEREPTRTAARLRSLLDERQNEFIDAVGGNRQYTLENRGFRYALILLLNSGLLVPFLVDPRRSSLEQASRLMRLLLAVDSDFSNLLVRLMDNGAAILDPIDRRLRVLDLITATGGQVANWRAIVKLSNSEDQGIRTRCVNLIARSRAGAKEIQSLFEKSDARTRADLLELLAASEHPATDLLIREALEDGNNRVAANACVAAYRSHNEHALRWLAEMISSDRPEAFQISAAWAIGETKDPRFRELLLAGVAAASKIRPAALRALTKLERIETYSVDVDRELVSAFEMPCAIAVDEVVERTLCLISTNGQGASAPAGFGTDYFLYVAGKPILDYTFEARRTGPTELRLACSLPVLRELAEFIRAKPETLPETISIYGASRAEQDDRKVYTPSKHIWVGSVAQSARSLVTDWRPDAYRQILLILDDAFPIDLNLRLFEEEAKLQGIDVYCVRFDTGVSASTLPLNKFSSGEGLLFWNNFTRALREGFRIRYRGPLSGVSLFARRAISTGCYATRKVEK